MPSGKPFKPTKEHRATVEAMAAVGMTQEEIATVLGIQRRALARHFREELDRAAIKADAKVLGTLFRMATSGTNPAATIFWAKVRRGWRERDDVAIGPVSITVTRRRADGSVSVTEAPALGEPTTTEAPEAAAQTPGEAPAGSTES